MWSATGEMINFDSPKKSKVNYISVRPKDRDFTEFFGQNEFMYAITITVFDPSAKKDNIIKTYSFPNVSSSTTPLLNIRPENFDVSIKTQVVLEIVDNTYYTTQPKLKLSLKESENTKPYTLLFTNTQALNNTSMRTVITQPLVYKNITLYFDNNNQY